jgi:hypothetical protein
MNSAMLGRRIAPVWGVLGVVTLLTQSLVRLSPRAWAAIAGGLSAPQWTLLGAWVTINAYAEGWRGFHHRFSPRVVARARVLARDARPLDAVFAPLFCMSLYHASRRGRWTARIVVVTIVALVLAVRLLPQPWRGIIDAGVVVGLGTGLLSLAWHAVRALGGRPPAIAPDVPDASAT